MERHTPLYHHQHQHQQQHPQSHSNIGDTLSDRFPQWSVQETKEFLVIRAELDQTFMETKRNKLLWEVISTQMKDKGFNRSPEQCKCKWKNLVTRYKGCETMEAEATRQQFPYYNEIQSIFAARMQRMLWAEAEGGVSKKKHSGQFSSDEEDENEESEELGEKMVTNVRKKMKKGKSNLGSGSSSNVCIGSSNSNVRDILEEFMKQQMQMEMQWRDSFEARERERAAKEMEWRQKMEALEKERLVMERRWREREEQWRVREEARAEKRDLLVNALLNKLSREGSL